LPQAKEIARQRIAKNSFELPADARREVERIYKRACQTVENAQPAVVAQ
jgi:hypothetical protein